MFTIGAFAHMAGLSAKTLRHYHDRDLLVPAWVDPNTGYRTYTLRQLDDAVRISVLRRGDLSAQWPVLLVILLCGVPAAAFVEELAFRGVLTHILGARWLVPMVAVGVPAVITSSLFSLAHGPTGALPFLAHAAGGVAYAVLCDRTGGLEASTAAHTAWNLALLGSVSLFEVHGAEAASVQSVALPLLLTDIAIVAAILLTLRGKSVERLRPLSHRHIAPERNAGMTHEV